MSVETDISKEPKGALPRVIAEAQPGDRIIYHVGINCMGEHRTDASAAYEAGLAILVQRRSKTPGLFEYMAVRSKKEVRA